MKMRFAWYAGVSPSRELLSPSPSSSEPTEDALQCDRHSAKWLTLSPLQVSTALAGSVVVSAFHQRANFYSALVHLSQSSLSLMVS